jgi:hypothetical protein
MTELKSYRQELEILKQAMESKYDSTVLALSSGGIGVSAIILQQLTEEVSGITRILLAIGWTVWGLSCVCILASFLSSKAALLKVIKDIDENKSLSEDCGGAYDKLTSILNLLSGVLFLAGLGIVASAIFNSL